MKFTFNNISNKGIGKKVIVFMYIMAFVLIGIDILMYKINQEKQLYYVDLMWGERITDIVTDRNFVQYTGIFMVGIILLFIASFCVFVYTKKRRIFFYTLFCDFVVIIVITLILSFDSTLVTFGKAQKFVSENLQYVVYLEEVESLKSKELQCYVEKKHNRLKYLKTFNLEGVEKYDISWKENTMQVVVSMQGTEKKEVFECVIGEQ